MRTALVVMLTVGVVACGDDADEGGADTEPSTVSVGTTAGLIQATADAVWVVTDEGVARIDPSTNEVVTIVEMEQPEYVYSDGSSLWASLFETNQVVRIDPASSAIADVLAVPDNPSGIVVLDGDVWVTSHRGAAVLRFPSGQTEAAATVTVGEPGPDGPLGLAAGLGSIWVGTPNVFTVSQIDPTTDQVSAEFGIPPGANPCGDIAVAGGLVQVSSCRVEASLSVIDPESGEVQVVPLDGLAIAVAVVDDIAWWAVQVAEPDTTSQLVRVDGETGALTVVPVAGVTAIGGVVVAFDSVWVSDESNGTVTRLPLSILG